MMTVALPAAVKGAKYAIILGDREGFVSADYI
jgi:hypothetical protein